MKLIQNNPFRAVGVLANATEREIQKNKAKIKAYSRVGKEIVFDDIDFPILDSIDRSESQINQACSNLEVNQSKLNHSIFWFLKTNPFDETAIAYLAQGNIQKALFIWDKITANKEITIKNYSSFSNLGTLQLLSNTKNQIQKGIETKVKLIEATVFNNFAKLVVDETHKIDKENQIKLFVDQVLQEISDKFSNNEILDLFENCNGVAKEYLSKKYVQEHIHIIENLITKTKRKRKEEPPESYNNGVHLYSESKLHLQEIQSHFGTENLQYKLLADNLAKEIMQCGIDYFKYWNDTRDPSVQSINLLKYAQTLAVSTPVKDRIKDNIEGVKEWKETSLIETDLVFIGKKLEDFQRQRDSIDNADALVHSCKPKLKNIKNIVGGSNELYLQLSSAVAHNALSMIINIVNIAQEGLNNNRHKLLALPEIVSSAALVTNDIGLLDMDLQMRKRYNENKNIIYKLNRDLEEIRRKIREAGRNVPAPNSEDDFNWLKLIGWGIAIFFLVKTCNS